MRHKKEESDERIIKDPLMEPYFISIDQYCHTLNELTVPDSRYTDNGVPYVKVIGHYSSFRNCLERIGTLKLNSKSYSSIKEYISEYESIKNELKNLVTI